MPGRSLYDVVGVDIGASVQEIRAAYRRAARDAHPDLGGSDAAFRQVSAAYEVLRDPARRARYDRWLAAQATGHAPAPPAAAGRAPAWPASSAPAPAGTGRAGRRAGGDTTRLQRNYLVTMTTCLLLFVLSGAVIRAYSVPAAVAMAVVAMVLLPFAALMANRRTR